MGKFLGPFCKDCKNCQTAAPYPDEPDDDYWNRVRAMSMYCAIVLPDVFMDKRYFDLRDKHGGGVNSCYNMRFMGPCGLKGILFEAKP